MKTRLLALAAVLALVMSTLGTNATLAASSRPSPGVAMLGLKLDASKVKGLTVTALSARPAAIWTGASEVDANSGTLKAAIAQGRMVTVVGHDLKWDDVHTKLGIKSAISLAKTSTPIEALGVKIVNGVPFYSVVQSNAPADETMLSAVTTESLKNALMATPQDVFPAGATFTPLGTVATFFDSAPQGVVQDNAYHWWMDSPTNIGTHYVAKHSATMNSGTSMHSTDTRYDLTWHNEALSIGIYPQARFAIEDYQPKNSSCGGATGTVGIGPATVSYPTFSIGYATSYTSPTNLYWNFVGATGGLCQGNLPDSANFEGAASIYHNDYSQNAELMGYNFDVTATYWTTNDTPGTTHQHHFTQNWTLQGGSAASQSGCSYSLTDQKYHCNG